MAPEAKAAAARKLVVRMLPPKLTEAEFRDSIAARWVDKFDWMRYEPGLVPDDAGRPITFTVAYLRFHTAELAAEFSEATDGAPYRDSTGGMCRCLVELAVCHSVPQRRGKPDAS